ncbi:MAG: hypothetical protein V1776_01545 [Candidatus Diapherotrites archaeon]
MGLLMLKPRPRNTPKKPNKLSKGKRPWRLRAALGIGGAAVAGSLFWGGYKLAPGYRMIRFMNRPPIELIHSIKKARFILPEVIVSAVSQGGKLTPAMEKRLHSLLRSRMPEWQVKRAMTALKTPKGQGAGFYLLCEAAHEEALKKEYVYWARNEYMGMGADGFGKIQPNSRFTVIIYGALHGPLLVDKEGVVQINRMTEDRDVLRILHQALEMEKRFSDEELAGKLK